MAKSIRSKSKRRFRAIKRTEVSVLQSVGNSGLTFSSCGCTQITVPSLSSSLTDVSLNLQVFKPVEDERLARLAKLQAEVASTQPASMETEVANPCTEEIEERGRAGAPSSTTLAGMDVDKELTPKQLKHQKMKLYMSRNQYRRNKKIEK